MSIVEISALNLSQDSCSSSNPLCRMSEGQDIQHRGNVVILQVLQVSMETLKSHDWGLETLPQVPIL